MTAKDHIRALFPLLAEGRLAEFQQHAREALHEIEKEISDLQLQAEHIKKALAQHHGSQVNEGRGSGRQGITDVQRRSVRQAAVSLASRNEVGINIAELLAEMKRQGVTLSVSNPAAVVASMLNRWKDFARGEGGKYRVSK